MVGDKEPAADTEIGENSFQRGERKALVTAPLHEHFMIARNVFFGSFSNLHSNFGGLPDRGTVRKFSEQCVSP